MSRSRTSLFSLFACSALGMLAPGVTALGADEIQGAATTQAASMPDALRPVTQQQLDSAGSN